MHILILKLLSKLHSCALVLVGNAALLCNLKPGMLCFIEISRCGSALCGLRHNIWSETCCVHCSFRGRLTATSLQHFVADQLLKLPQVSTITPRNLDSFLAKAPQHKVTVLAFTSSPSRASIPLRHAAQQHGRHVVAGRVQWVPQVWHYKLFFPAFTCSSYE